MTELDHITVAAYTLEQGLAHVRAVLGVEVPRGGAHPRMGTHNYLLRLGETLFLEVLAVDPSAPAPPRFFHSTSCSGSEHRRRLCRTSRCPVRMQTR